MHVLWKSILTGFGMKIGSEIAKIVSEQIQTRLDEKEEETAEEGDGDKEVAEPEEIITPLPGAPLPTS